MNDYSSPFLLNPMCMDNDSLGWYFAREDFTRTGSREAYDLMLSYVSSASPLLEWE